MTSEAAGPTPAYPIQLEVQRAAKQSRLTNFPLGIGTFIRFILLIPHIIILSFLGIVAFVLYFIATFAILFSGRYPQGMYNFIAGYMRWNVNINAYTFSLMDAYPPFSSEQQDYPVSFTAEYPQTSSRLLNFPFFGWVIRYFLLIPHLVVVSFLGLAAYVILIIAQFAILFTGAFPAGMHGFVTGVTRWSTRLNCYMFGLSDRYPPFSMN